MKQTLHKIIKALVKDGTTDAGELYKIALDQTANWSPRPEPEEIEKVITEITKKHEESKKLGIELVKNWVEEGSGEFGLNLIYSELGVRGQHIGEAVVRQNLKRLVEKGLIVPSGKKRGYYRRVEKEAMPLDWASAKPEPMEVSLPFELDRMVNIFPGNIIIVAGATDSGKSAWCIDFVKRNMHKYRINYFSSEMGESEFKIRLSLHDDLTPEEWDFKAYERSENFGDVIIPDEINIIDYLEVHDNFWLVSKDLAHIHHRLGRGLAVVAIQKGQFNEAGRGGEFGMEKPRLYITLSKAQDHRGGIVKILKAKNWKDSGDNPNGKIMYYKLVKGARFIYSGDWGYAPPTTGQKKVFS